jgi:hypothetical protein
LRANKLPVPGATSMKFCRSGAAAASVVPPAVTVRRYTSVTAPVTFQCGARAVPKVSSTGVDDPTCSR